MPGCNKSGAPPSPTGKAITPWATGPAARSSPPRKKTGWSGRRSIIRPPAVAVHPVVRVVGLGQIGHVVGGQGLPSRPFLLRHPVVGSLQTCSH